MHCVLLNELKIFLFRYRQRSLKIDSNQTLNFSSKLVSKCLLNEKNLKLRKYLILIQNRL